MIDTDINNAQYSESVSKCLDLILRKCIEYASYAPHGSEDPQHYVLKRLIAIVENFDNE